MPARQFVYKLSLNGHFVGVGPTQPVTSSETRYDGYDVTSLLKPGATNTLGALCYTTTGQQFDALLVVRYTDGSTQTFGTGPVVEGAQRQPGLPASSAASARPTTPRRRRTSTPRGYPFGFDTPGFDDSGWPAAAAEERTSPTSWRRRRRRSSSISRRRSSVTEYSPGNYVIDYGRTWVGGLSLDLDGTRRPGGSTSATARSCPTRRPCKYQAQAGETYEDKWTLKSRLAAPGDLGPARLPLRQRARRAARADRRRLHRRGLRLSLRHVALAVRLLRRQPQPGLAAEQEHHRGGQPEPLRRLVGARARRLRGRRLPAADGQPLHRRRLDAGHLLDAVPDDQPHVADRVADVRDPGGRSTRTCRPATSRRWPQNYAALQGKLPDKWFDAVDRPDPQDDRLQRGQQLPPTTTSSTGRPRTATATCSPPTTR